MRPKTAGKIRLMHAQGLSINQIADKLAMSADEIEDYLLVAGFDPIYNVRQARQQNPKRKEIREYMENQRVLGVPMQQKKKPPLTAAQLAMIRDEFEEGTKPAEIAAKFSRDVSYIYQLRRKWQADKNTNAQTQEDSTMDNTMDNTKKAPAPAATGESATESTPAEPTAERAYDNNNIRDLICQAHASANIALNVIYGLAAEIINANTNASGFDGKPLFTLGILAERLDILGNELLTALTEVDKND